MADSEKNKSLYPQRLALKDTKSARKTLCRLIRLRFTDKISATLFRDIIYGLNVLLSFDKTLTENEIIKRIESLEENYALKN